MAPEVILKKKTYFPSVDIWSVGVIFEELMSPEIKPIFFGSTEIE